MELVLALVAIVGAFATTVYNSWSTRKRDTTIGAQQVRLNELAQHNAERMRLVEQKHTAYALLLEEVSTASERQYLLQQDAKATVLPGESASLRLYSTSLWTALYQANLLLDADSGQKLDDAIQQFFLSHLEHVKPTLQTVTEILRADLSA